MQVKSVNSTSTLLTINIRESRLVANLGTCTIVNKVEVEFTDFTCTEITLQDKVLENIDPENVVT